MKNISIFLFFLGSFAVFAAPPEDSQDSHLPASHSSESSVFEDEFCALNGELSEQPAPPAEEGWTSFPLEMTLFDESVSVSVTVKGAQNYYEGLKSEFINLSPLPAIEEGWTSFPLKMALFDDKSVSVSVFVTAKGAQNYYGGLKSKFINLSSLPAIGEGFAFSPHTALPFKEDTALILSFKANKGAQNYEGLKSEFINFPPISFLIKEQRRLRELKDDVIPLFPEPSIEKRLKNQSFKFIIRAETPNNPIGGKEWSMARCFVEIQNILNKIQQRELISQGVPSENIKCSSGFFSVSANIWGKSYPVEGACYDSRQSPTGRKGFFSPILQLSEDEKDVKLMQCGAHLSKLKNSNPENSAWKNCVINKIRAEREKLKLKLRTEPEGESGQNIICLGYYGSGRGWKAACKREGDPQIKEVTTGYQPYPESCQAFPGAVANLERK